MNSEKADTGIVYLVGSGPGDEGLFTLKGVEKLKEASVVVYDNLVNKALLKYVSPEAELIFVGKMSNRHTLPQEEINRLLVEKALAGERVVRLKGGDPYIFGRGGEEVLELVAAGIPFEVVPGITAASGATAYAGIPLTHRGYTSQLTFITGHEQPGKEESDLDWKQLAASRHTLAIYMGVSQLPEIIRNLTDNGMPLDTPVALIRWGTLTCQETIAGTAADIVEKVEQAGLKPPAIIIVGRVIELREKLRWFDKRPLFGKRIVVTRSRDQASRLTVMLESLGAEVIELPTISIQPVEDYRALEDALGELSGFSWIVFTSTNGVDIFFQKLFASGRDCRALAGCRFGVIGKETAAVLLKYGIRADLIPESFTSEGTVEAFRKWKSDFSGERVLLPGSDIARNYIPEELKKMGAEVTILPVYKTVMPATDREYVASVFEPMPHAVTFTSSSTVDNLAALLTEKGFGGLIGGIQGISIGPMTTRTAEERGISILKEADPHTIPGLVAAVQSYFQERDKI